MTYRSQIFPLRLTKSQRRYMLRASGCARFAYNWALGEWKRQAKEWWDGGKVTEFPSAFALQRQLTKMKKTDFPWMLEVASSVTEQAIVAVQRAYENYRAGSTRYPRFKNKASKRSFVAAPRKDRVRFEGRYIVLPRVGRIRIGGTLRWPGIAPIFAVISERAGKWFVAVRYDMPPIAFDDTEKATAAGVDLGISSPLTVTCGAASLHLGHGLSERLNLERRKLRRANKRMHRRQAGSRRRYRARLQVARIHQRMANIRADVQHKATHLISGMARRVGVETLAVRNMMQNGRLARAIADVGFYEIKRQLKYKADEVIEADRFYPSSKTCSCCGHVKETLTLADRTYHCDECGYVGDRDENAARNLEKMAATCAVSARGARSPAPKRKFRLSSLAAKREAANGNPRAAHWISIEQGGKKQ